MQTDWCWYADQFPSSLQRNMTASPKEANGASIATKMDSTDLTASLGTSPSGKSPSLFKQVLRTLSFVVWFNLTCICIVTTQFLGVPLALWDKNLFYAYRRQEMVILTVVTFPIQRRASELRSPQLLNGIWYFSEQQELMEGSHQPPSSSAEMKVSRMR